MNPAEPLKRQAISFCHAFAGLKLAFKTQLSFRWQLVAAVAVTVLAAVLRVSYAEWLVLVVTMGLVLVAELLNTALEFTVDLVCEKWDPKAKKAKDVAAAMVTMAAAVSVVVGVVVFLPKIYQLIGG